MKAFTETTSTGEEYKQNLPNFGGYGQTYGMSEQCESSGYGYEDDVYRSLDTDVSRSIMCGGPPMDADPVQKHRSVASYSAPMGESYDSFTRADASVLRHDLAIAQPSFSVHQSPQKGFGINFENPGFQMAQQKQQYRQTDKSLFSFELEDIQSWQANQQLSSDDDMAMMAQDDDETPEFYRRDSTFECTTESVPQTMAAIGESLRIVASSQKLRHLTYTQVTCSQFEGQFCQDARLCEFMITIWTEGQNQIMVELRNLSSGLDCKLSYDTFKRELVTSLKTRKILNELFDTTFEPLAEIHFGDEYEPISQTPDERELRALIQDRVHELHQANFLGKQRELSAEIMCIAKTQLGAQLVAEAPELAGILAGILKKNARSDIQMSRTILSLMRTLLAYRRFDDVTDSSGKRVDVVKTLIQTADSTEDNAWATDLFDTILALQQSGMEVSGKRAKGAYTRIKARAEAFNNRQ